MPDADAHHALQPLTDASHLGWVGSSFNLALDRISQQTDRLSETMSDLDQGVQSCRLELQSHPQRDANRAISLNNLANALFARFELSGMVPDLNDAIDYHREVLGLFPDSRDQSASLNNLAFCLYSRFKRLGMLSDLQEAMSLHRKELERRHEGHHDRPTTMNNLALCLSSLFEQQGVESDLDEAIRLLSSALALLQPHDSDRSFVSLNLGDCLYTRFKHTVNIGDLLKAIDFHRQALPHQDAHLYASSSLARSLFTRFEVSGDMADLEAAMNFDRDTITRCLCGHSIRPKSLHNLGECLFARFGRTGELSNLNAAIKCHREVLGLRPLGHPDRSSSLNCLAKCFLARSKHSERTKQTDLGEAFKLYYELMDVSQNGHTVFLQDVHAAKDWVDAAEEHKHRKTIEAYQTLFKLLVNHLATLPSLTQHFTQLKKLTSSLSVDAFSACLRHGSPIEAVELLEQGRAVFWGLLSRLRSPLEEVIAFGDRGKRLVEKFRQLASPLRHASQHEEAWDLNARLQEVVSDIRGLPGLSRFLLPPFFSDLQLAASGGPVIIVNASKYGCDGLIVLPDRDPIHVPLEISPTQITDFSSRVSSILWESREPKKGIFSSLIVGSLTKMLRLLWKLVVSPIVAVLEGFLPHQSRIWWCPTADFALLPLHAAGPFRKGQPNLPDLYISSYTITLATLVRARQSHPSDSTRIPKFLAVAVGCTPNLPVIKGVYSELDNIMQRISPYSTFTALKDKDATVEKVIEELQRNQFVHFSCHGGKDRGSNSFESALSLDDGPLEIKNIMQHNMQRPRLAYLSACSTTVGDAQSPDEAIHLAAVMQFTGFQSVIGTIWSVMDQDAAQVASKFYDNMLDDSGRLDHTRAASALHESLKNKKIPLGRRVVYVHLGA